MKTQTVYFNLTSKFNNQTIVKPTLNVKGLNTINYVFSGISEVDYKVDTLHINWGDGSDVEVYKRDLFYNYKTQSIFDEVLYGKLGGSVMTKYSHEFTNSTRLYGLKYVSSVLINKNDGSYVLYVQPINVYWDSFYDSVERLRILNTQILPTSSNFTFVNFESKKDGMTFPAVLHTIGIPDTEPYTDVNILEPYSVFDTEEFIYLSEQDSDPIADTDGNIITIIPGLATPTTTVPGLTSAPVVDEDFTYLSTETKIPLEDSDDNIMIP